ncbi:hypothetical protein [Nonomuraea typhae]|uniref:hypothetical protein n=1 Tax=Nonomuraea typhae TaxID=2603600 RepID=UPI0012FA9D21|nr:hypothetical protein [Nonomuraea typhae]
MAELLDQDHPRASVSDGDHISVNAGQVLDNIALAMERLDLDINTPISIDEDVVALNELIVMVRTLQLGSALATHVVNTAMRLMAARYPAELVRRPLPPEYDLQKLAPLRIRDRQQDIAKTIFNRRAASTQDLTEQDVAAYLEPLEPAGQIEVFVALFTMYEHKIGAMKYTTGIE